jgi:hypothetical protein
MTDEFCFLEDLPAIRERDFAATAGELYHDRDND